MRINYKIKDCAAGESWECEPLDPPRELFDAIASVLAKQHPDAWLFAIEIRVDANITLAAAKETK